MISPETLIVITAFIFGAAIGSFMNVCIYRLPLEKSLVLPRSFCPKCGHQISWFENIPLFSYCLLRCKCRHCGNPISFRYFFVELLTALVFAYLALLYTTSGGSIPVFLLKAAFICSLIVVTFIDFDFQIIPNEISYGGAFIAVIASFLLPELHGTTSHIRGLGLSLLGLIVGSSSLYLLGVIGTWVFKKDAMGMGDVKLLGMVGAFLGWQMAFFSLFAGSILGALVSFFLLVTGKVKMGNRIPFGPYLSAGAVVALLWGQDIFKLYLKWIFG